MKRDAFCFLSREYTSNVKIWQSQLYEIQRLEKITNTALRFSLGSFSWPGIPNPSISAFLPYSHRPISVFSPNASYLHLVRYFCADGTRMHSCERQFFTCRPMQSADHVKGGSEAQGDSYGLKDANRGKLSKQPHPAKCSALRGRSPRFSPLLCEGMVS